jgi:hypothetical protein
MHRLTLGYAQIKTRAWETKLFRPLYHKGSWKSKIKHIVWWNK